MIPRKYYIRNVVRRDVVRRDVAKYEIVKRYLLSRHFQFRSSSRYRGKALKPLFRGDGGFWGEPHHFRGFRRMVAMIRDCLDCKDVLVRKTMTQKNKYLCQFRWLWDDDHCRHAIHGWKSWKRRCRKRHQWERHCHSQFEMGYLQMGYKPYRHFILKMLRENGGTFTFNTSHRYDLEEILTSMEYAGEILLDIDHNDRILYHSSIAAHFPQTASK